MANGSDASHRSNAITVYKNGNIALGKIVTTHLIHLSGGAYSDGSTWVNSSDRNLKEKFKQVDGREILDLINDLPVTEWNYKTDGLAIKHIGPVAQDFYSIFGLGNDDKSISSIDPAGIALVAIQELSRENKDLKQQINSYQLELQNLHSEFSEIKEKLAGKSK